MRVYLFVTLEDYTEATGWILPNLGGRWRIGYRRAHSIMVGILEFNHKGAGGPWRGLYVYDLAGLLTPGPTRRSPESHQGATALWFGIFQIENKTISFRQNAR